jgi:hypothetical protein
MKTCVLFLSLMIPVASAIASSEAPAGFGNATNGMISQGQFDLDLATFEEREGIADGLGPVYNAQACAECHQNSVTGGNSQVSVLRVGRYDGRTYQDRPGGSLIQDRAIDPAFQPRQCTDVPHVAQHPRRRLCGSRRRQHVRDDPVGPARRDERDDHPRAGP